MRRTVAATLIVDDLDEGTPAQATIAFTLSDGTYELDVSAASEAQVRKALAPFLAHARVDPDRRATQIRPATVTGHAAASSAQMRAWARRALDVDVPSRGPVPATIRALYDAAHSDGIPDGRQH